MDINKQGKAFVWNYNESPPRVRVAEPAQENSPEYSKAPPRTKAKVDFMRNEEPVNIDEALTPPPNLPPPVMNGPYLQANAHPFNSLPTAERFLSSTPVNQNGQRCTCQGPRNDPGLTNSRYADPIRTVVFMPHRFTDPCPVHQNDHIYGQGNSAF